MKSTETAAAVATLWKRGTFSVASLMEAMELPHEDAKAFGLGLAVAQHLKASDLGSLRFAVESFSQVPQNRTGGPAMAEQINDGGPAFPQPEFAGIARRGGLLDEEHGMSLRDYFAAHAHVQVPEDVLDPIEWSKLCRIPHPEDSDDVLAWDSFWARCEAIMRYRYADAMLAARERLSP